MIIPAAALRFAPSNDGKKTAAGGQVWVLDGASASPSSPSSPSRDAAPTQAGDVKAPSGQAQAGATGTLRGVPVKVVQKAGMRVQVEAKGLEPGAAVVVEEIGARSGGRRPPRIF